MEELFGEDIEFEDPAQRDKVCFNYTQTLGNNEYGEDYTWPVNGFIEAGGLEIDKSCQT